MTSDSKCSPMLEQPINHVVVVIPACDEEELVEACVVAVAASIARLPEEVAADMVVVANGCSDRTAARARQAGARIIVDDVANVGAARAAGCGWALANAVPQRLWIATTDADSAVPEAWLPAQLAAAARGVDVFLGIIELAPGDAARHPTWCSEYARRSTGREHGHVHGANLGFRGDAYLKAGGFRALTTHEDADLVDRLLATGATPYWAEIPVTTSARHVSRVERGVSADLAASERRIWTGPGEIVPAPARPQR
ncbi:glycosyltransferase [Aeromicrobium sp.]|uniref:glycosyltransferase n=1 Tax=Aeromicrobium sp. TaxID=1871063 RepID=UPI003C5840C4